MNAVAEEVESTEPISYEKGSWQENLQKSSNLLTRSTKARKTASALLWKGAKSGIEAWLPESATDVSGEGLYGQVTEALGTARKGDASKIKTVAVAVRQHSLDLSTFGNLSKAYAEARRLTQTVQAQADEDSAADEAIAQIEPPKSTSSVDGAAAILLSKGVDGAVVAILDALGAKNEAAHRAFLRAVQVEVAARVTANKPVKPVVAKKAAAPKPPAAKKAAAVKGKPKGKPATGAGSAPDVVDDAPEPVEDADGAVPDADMFDEIEGTEDDTTDETQAVETSSVPVAKKAAGRGRPVVRRPGK